MDEGAGRGFEIRVRREREEGTCLQPGWREIPFRIVCMFMFNTLFTMRYRSRAEARDCGEMRWVELRECIAIRVLSSSSSVIQVLDPKTLLFPIHFLFPIP